jgi:hypothetical protein
MLRWIWEIVDFAGDWLDWDFMDIFDWGGDDDDDRDRRRDRRRRRRTRREEAEMELEEYELARERRNDEADDSPIQGSSARSRSRKE